MATHGSGIWRYDPDVTVPAAPGAPMVTQTTPTSISLSWSGVPGALGYKVYYGTQSGTYSDSVDVPVSTSTTLIGLSGEAYHIRLKAYNLVGESDFSPEVEVIINLFAPSNLSASSSALCTSVTLTWKDNSNYEDGYELQKKRLGDGEWVVLDTVTDTCYTLNNLVPYTDYMCRVRAVAQGITSGFDTVRFTTSPIFRSVNWFPSYANRLIKYGDKLYLVFVDKSNSFLGHGRVKYTYKNFLLGTVSWHEPVSVSGDTLALEATIAPGNGDNIYVAWVETPLSYGSYIIFKSLFSNEADTIFILNDAFPHTFISGLNLLIDENDTAHMSWSIIDTDEEVGYIVYAKFDKEDPPNPSTVETEVVAFLSENLYWEKGEPGLSMSIYQGRPYLMYSEGCDIKLAEKVDSYTWTVSAFAPGTHPVLRVDEDGMFAVWEDPASQLIYYT